jgi:hypothetical protein
VLDPDRRNGPLHFSAAVVTENEVIIVSALAASMPRAMVAVQEAQER